MKKFSVLNFVFNIVTLLLLFAILAYNSYYRSMNLQSNNFLSENSRRFSSDKFSDYIHLKGFFFANSYDEYIIREENIAETIPIGILAKNFVPQFELMGGRFFRNFDYFNNQRVAVVGSNITTEIGGIVDVHGQQYKVIGVIQGYASPKINNAIYYNLDSSISTTDVFTVDGNSALMVDRIFNILSKTAKAKEIFAEDISFDRFTGDQSSNRDTYNLMMLLGVVIQLIKVLFAVRDNAKRIRIQYTFGKMKSGIFRDITTKVFVESSTAFVVILSLFFSLEHYIRLNELLFGSLILFVVASIEIILSPIQILNFTRLGRNIFFKDYWLKKGHV